MNRIFVPALLLGTLAITCVYMAQRGSEQSEARQLSQSLRRHQYYYQHAIDQQHALMSAATRALDAGQTVEPLRRDVLEIKAQFEDLHGRLQRLPVRGSVRDRMLDPLLHQLTDQAVELERLASRLSEQRGAVREQLGHYRQPANLMAPALQDIARQYGMPRPKLWRGRPLVS